MYWLNSSPGLCKSCYVCLISFSVFLSKTIELFREAVISKLLKGERQGAFSKDQQNLGENPEPPKGTVTLPHWMVGRDLATTKSAHPVKISAVRREHFFRSECFEIDHEHSKMGSEECLTTGLRSFNMIC